MNNTDLFADTLDDLENKIEQGNHNHKNIFGKFYPADDFSLKMHNNEVTASRVNSYRAGADIEADVLRKIFMFVTRDNAAQKNN
jgi:hypothetical protein